MDTFSEISRILKKERGVIFCTPPLNVDRFNCESEGVGGRIRSPGQTYFLTPSSHPPRRQGHCVTLNLMTGFPSCLSCIFIAVPRAPYLWKFTKRLTAKINNKKSPPLKSLTLWKRPTLHTPPCHPAFYVATRILFTFMFFYD